MPTTPTVGPRAPSWSTPGAVIISSFSKHFGMTGWRLCWTVLPEGPVQAAENLAITFFLCASAPPG
ncbi:hypothetical protein B6G06_03860 [Actinomyces gaoshouyii]|uniref:Aminotransferase class I/classII large domain-containing protein n=1 Tax=Actinomyces gaoshouyii TaxID=1960083 RepID=A0A8H9LLM3_9ACTO|nr:hypothetical protein B6G06_03860 [Actinomyces gaoshouyii]GGO98211.1 hypothetical protein GCM10011612_12610 [Actinomyces gaoshouyii]